jgi:hypothetical protein
LFAVRFNGCAGNNADRAAVAILSALCDLRIVRRAKLRQGLLGNLAERLRRVLH